MSEPLTEKQIQSTIIKQLIYIKRDWEQRLNSLSRELYRERTKLEAFKEADNFYHNPYSDCPSMLPESTPGTHCMENIARIEKSEENAQVNVERWTQILNYTCQKFGVTLKPVLGNSESLELVWDEKAV